MSEAEDEMCAVLLWEWMQLHSEKEKRLWVHSINKKRTEENTLQNFIKEIKKDENKFKNFTRMHYNTFTYVLDKIKDRIVKRDTNFRKSITPEERLFITLRYLALGERFQSLHYYFRVGATTIGNLVEETCNAIWEELSVLHMEKPTTDKWNDIAEKFNRLWNFPNCLRAVDGKHIRIECPRNSGSSFFNYKNFHSIVLQAVVDAEAKFLFVDVGDYGRNSDSGIFKNSYFGKHFFSKKLEIPPPPRQLCAENDNIFPFVFVADEAYPLSVNLMRPFPKKQLCNQKRIFNYRLSRARRIVECAFGMLTKKFRVLQNAMLLSPEKATIVTLACCTLHNVIRDREGTLQEIHEELIQCEENDDNTGANFYIGRSHAGINVRTQYVEYFNSEEGSVPWQNKYAHVNE